MSAIDRLLSALDRTKQVKPGAWMAACPCCRSRKGRPLAVTDSGDGRALLHAFCGCDTEAVLSALGLSITDLFDAPLAHAGQSVRAQVSSSDVLASLTNEANVLAIIAADFLENRSITEETWQRLATATQRLNHACDFLER